MEISGNIDGKGSEMDEEDWASVDKDFLTHCDEAKLLEGIVRLRCVTQA